MVQRPDRMAEALQEYTSRLRDNYPFFHPRYAGQMLKPPHPAAVAAYTAAMLINPNNHALDGGPATAAMELEVVAELARMFGFPAKHLGHLTSSGTIANLEALWIARGVSPDRVVAFSADAHYTHGRMCSVLGVETRTIPAGRDGRMEPEAVLRAMQDGRVGTLVLTAGSTGMGAVDPIADLIPMAREHGVRVHIDAAYGGFFRILAEDGGSPLGAETRRHLLAIADADSVAVDPHKHGLQPYGCGAVLFRDPRVGKHYKHDSPYTYFTSDDLHLGEISLECSRAGASAGALWLTLRLFPLQADQGLGPVLSACLEASNAWADRINKSVHLELHTRPELDIVVFHPAGCAPRAAAIDQASAAVFEAAMADPEDPIFLSVLKMPAGKLRHGGQPVRRDRQEARVLRSVLMKPEHREYIPHLHARIERLAAEAAENVS
jgi:glutamate/tyrosine decarboxylase-like PLP-dependent enzyme